MEKVDDGKNGFFSPDLSQFHPRVVELHHKIKAEAKRKAEVRAQTNTERETIVLINMRDKTNSKSPEFLTKIDKEVFRENNRKYWDADLIGYEQNNQFLEANDQTTESDITGFALWLGSCAGATHFEALKKWKISAIVNMGAVDMKFEMKLRKLLGVPWDPAPEWTEEWHSKHIPGIRYLSMTIKDDPTKNISECFEPVMKFIGECRKEGRRVLVHCIGGVNRSNSVSCAFLANTEYGFGLGIEDSVMMHARRRNLDCCLQKEDFWLGILCNVAFLEQLVMAYHKGEWENENDKE